jgi:hypothetical protein
VPECDRVISSKVYEIVLIVLTAYPLPLLGTRRHPQTVGNSARIKTVDSTTPLTGSTTSLTARFLSGFLALILLFVLIAHRVAVLG